MLCVSQRTFLLGNFGNKHLNWSNAVATSYVLNQHVYHQEVFFLVLSCIDRFKEIYCIVQSFEDSAIS